MEGETYKQAFQGHERGNFSRNRAWQARNRDSLFCYLLRCVFQSVDRSREIIRLTPTRRSKKKGKRHALIARYRDDSLSVFCHGPTLFFLFFFSVRKKRRILSFQENCFFFFRKRENMTKRRE